MGLASVILGGLKTGATFLGRQLGILAPAATTAARTGGGLLAGAGRVLASPIGGTIAGFGIGSALFGGDGGVAAGGGGQLQAIAEAGGQVTPLANGQFMAIAPNGDMQIFNRNGQPRRPSMIIPAGQPLPAGAIVVATRMNGAQIGIVKRRRRRRFGAEIVNVRDTVRAAQQLVNLCKPKARRSSHG